MDFRHLSSIDLKLRLLSGSPIQLDGFKVEPYKVSEIRDFGYENYMRNLQWFNVTVDDFIKSTDDLEKKIELEVQRSKLKVFDFFANPDAGELLDYMLESLAMIFKTEDVHLLDVGVIGINFVKLGILSFDEEGYKQIDTEWLNLMPEEKIIMIHRDNFDELSRLVKYQNFLSNVKDQSFNPANEEARKLAEQMERNRKRVEEKKRLQQKNENGDEDDVDISDIISAITAKSNSINKFNVWDLTLFQLYDEYSRLELIDNYEFSVKAMMAGAKDVALRHWSTKLS